MKNKYFIPFPLTKDINSFRLLKLYDLSDTEGQVKYKNKSQLARELNVSNSTITRLFQYEAKGRYKKFFSIDTEKKVIQLHNNFRKSKTPFIILDKKEVEFLRGYEELGDIGNIFVEYYCYLKFYTSKGSSDFTSNQFIESVGRSLNANKYHDYTSIYNNILTFKKIVRIEYFRDEKQQKRCRYTWLGL